MGDRAVVTSGDKVVKQAEPWGLTTRQYPVFVRLRRPPLVVDTAGRR